MMSRRASLEDLERLTAGDFEFGAVEEPVRLPLAADADDLGLSPAWDVSSGRNKPLAFRSAREIAASLPPEVDRVVGRYVAAGSLHELVGHAKRAGKTTLVCHLIRAVLDGLPFLGEPTQASPVVFLTEQPLTSLREVLERTGLDDRDDLSILSWKDTYGVPWTEVVDAAVNQCERVGAGLLVVDTLPAFAGIRGEAENDAGTALAAMEPLQLAAADGLAVLMVRHERKGGGEVGESGRGSSAFTGTVDVVLRLARQPNAARPTIRVLSTLSRFGETPDEVVIELEDGGYRALGDQTAVAFTEARAAVLDVVPDDGEGMPEQAIIEETGAKKTMVGNALRDLAKAGEIEKTGNGRRGSPYRYRRTRPIVSPAPKGGAVGESKSAPVDDPRLCN